VQPRSGKQIQSAASCRSARKRTKGTAREEEARVRVAPACCHPLAKQHVRLFDSKELDGHDAVVHLHSARADRRRACVVRAPAATIECPAAAA
jgi:hypothetical protein